MNFQSTTDYKNVSVIKFTDNIRFSLDGDSIRDIVRTNHSKVKGNTFAIVGKVVDVITGVQEDVEVLITFKGFFRESAEGKLVIPKEIHPKDYDKFIRHKPYLLTFVHGNLKPVS